MPEEMHEYKVILTWEAIYDVTDITDYIEAEFGQARADRFQDDIKREMEKLGYMGGVFPKTQILYRNYYIHKKPIPPSIIFYILMEQKREIHVLRVLREERDWQHILNKTKGYTYPT
ncbi:type II toxin-antitoxin system RelE/ParE family toxin [Faecalicatena contorta]|uniref:type II toxin-antitoxin system RelE/ParE family toxin n=1 Tax=Faecalicatena contorta TaxID=39482 RepID=UPI001F23ABC4|nr:type II toxin-antitoxin system RelE/ParE family toxin [Faecalicatena contorta]